MFGVNVRIMNANFDNTNSNGEKYPQVKLARTIADISKDKSIGLNRKEFVIDDDVISRLNDIKDYLSQEPINKEEEYNRGLFFQYYILSPSRLNSFLLEDLSSFTLTKSVKHVQEDIVIQIIDVALDKLESLASMIQEGIRETNKAFTFVSDIDREDDIAFDSKEGDGTSVKLYYGTVFKFSLLFKHESYFFNKNMVSVAHSYSKYINKEL